MHGVLRHVPCNGIASFQSHPNHANTFRPNPADRAIPHTKELQAETGSFGALKPNTFTCARKNLISRAHGRVWKGVCHLRLLAFAGMIGQEGSSRLHHLDQGMGDPSVLEKRLLGAAAWLSLRRCHRRHDLPDLTIKFWHSVFVRAAKNDGATSLVFWWTSVHTGSESRSRRSPCRLGLRAGLDSMTDTSRERNACMPIAASKARQWPVDPSPSLFPDAPPSQLAPPLPNPCPSRYCSSGKSRRTNVTFR